MASAKSAVVFSLLAAISSCLAQDISSDSNTCENICLSFANRTQTADSVGYCARGCRLMRLIDFANDGESSLDDLHQMCIQSCNSAYGDASSAVTPACHSGCNSQLPFVAERRRQLAMFYQEAEQFFEMMEWLSSVLNCFSSTVQQPGDRDYYVRARIVVIRSSVNDDETVRSSFYGEVPAIVDEPDRVSITQDSSWIDCMAAGSGMSRPLIAFIFGITSFVLTFFTFFVCCPICCRPKPTSRRSGLSIYGDGEILKTLDEDDEDLLIRDKPAVEESRVILMKIPVHSV